MSNHTLRGAFFFLFLAGLLFAEPQHVFMRVTLLKAEPQAQGALTGMILYTLPHQFTRRAAWGLDGDIVEFSTGFHAVINYDALSSVAEIPVGSSGRWIDLTKELNQSYHPESRWKKLDRTRAAQTMYIGFFARELDRRSDQRPIFKRNELGNFSKVEVSVDFSSRAEASGILRSFTVSSLNSGVALYIDPEETDPERAFASLQEMIARRTEALRAIGVQGKALPDRILLSRRNAPGYFLPFWDKAVTEAENALAHMLGIRSIQYWTVERPPDFMQFAYASSNPVFFESTRPEWISADPADGALQSNAEKAAKRLPVFKEKDLLAKFGDETSVLPEKLCGSSGVRKLFASYLGKRDVAPGILGYTALGDVELLTDIKGAVSAETRRLYYYSCQFRSEVMLDWYKRMIVAIRAAYPGKLLATGEICWEDSRHSPEIFRAYEMDVYDIASHECATLLWVMPHGAIWRLATQRSAARYFENTRPGILYGSTRGGKGMEDIVELDGTNALIDGMEHIYWYDYGPYTPFGHNPIPYDRKIALLSQRAADLEKLILDGRSPLRQPAVALIKSYANEFWNGNTQQEYFQEFELAAAALAWNQIAFDILSDEAAARHAGKYQAIYLASAVLPLASRDVLKPWVENGGRLILLGDATATRNEFNEPDDFAKQLGAKAADALEFSKIDLGKGCVFRFGGQPGLALRNSFSPVDKELPVKSVFHEFDVNLCRKYIGPLEAAPPIEQAMSCSRTGVVMNFYEAANGEQAAVLLADYTRKEFKPVTVKAALQGNYRTACDESGKSFPVGRLGRFAILEDIPLGASSVLILR